MLRLLDAMCRFEVLRPLGDAERHPRIPWPRRASSQRANRTDYALRLGDAADDAGHRARA